MRPSRILLILGSVTVWVLAFAGLYHVFDQHSARPDANPLFIVAYMAALIALAGWMAQALISVRNSRKQHSINLLFQYRMNKQFSDHVANIQMYFPDTTPIAHRALVDHPDASIFESIRFVLNYYEFIAVGIRHGDLDMDLMRDCQCSQMLTFCHRCEDVIKTARGEDQWGRPAPGKARILQNLRWLQRKWERFARKHGRPPLRARAADFFLRY